MATIAQPTKATARPRGIRSKVDSSRADSRVKITLYLVAGLLAVVIFVAPLLWFLMRSLLPGAVISAPPNSSTFFRLTFNTFSVLANQRTRALMDTMDAETGWWVFTGDVVEFALSGLLDHPVMGESRSFQLQRPPTLG